VRHKNSVFHDLVKRVPWAAFERLVDEHKADKHIRRLPTKSQLIALLYGQFSGAVSLREIVGGLESHGSCLYHVGARPVSRSTLADANSARPSAVFAGLLAALIKQAGRGLRRTMDEAVYLIDSTSVRLSGAGTEWARFSHQACGAKLHIVYDANAELPIYAAVTAANVNDIVAAKAMPIQPGATYVFDLGYYDFSWWAQMQAQGCRIVTRLKSHTLLTVTEARAVTEAGAILSDRIGFLPQRQAGRRSNPCGNPMREIALMLPTGKTIRLLTNDLDSTAETIADLYKRRWAIELFFRWIKQTLKIKHFLGTSENAVRIQIAVALIAFLLLRLAQAAQSVITSPLAFARLVRTNLMHRRRIDRLIPAIPIQTNDTSQMVLKWE
jgi:hypothetical protein